MKKLSISLVILYLIFPFYFSSIHKIQVVLLYSIAFFYFICKFKFFYVFFTNRYYISFFWASVIGISLLTMISLLLPVFYQTNDFGYLSNIFSFFRTCLLSLVMFIFICKDNDYTLEEYLLYYIRAVSLYVIFSLVFLIPGIRSFWVSIVYIKGDREKELINSIFYYSRFGLQGFSGFGHTFHCSVAILFVWYIIIQKIKQKIKIFILYYVMLFIGCILYGRIGLIAVLISSALSIIYISIKYKKMVSLFTAILFLIIISFTIFVNIDSIIRQYPWVSWALEPFINLYKYGNFKSSSSDVLLTMFKFPGINTFINGDGRYVDGSSYYMDTDVGFLRPLYFWGFIPTIIYYMIFIILLVPIAYKLRKKSGFFFCFLIFTTLIIYEIKGERLFAFYSVLLPVYLKIGLQNGA